MSVDKAVSDEKPSILIENDRDSLHILPLEILPLQTPALKRARMIKNAHLQSAIEMFKDDEAGSGQLYVKELPQEFNWEDPMTNPDMVMLTKVSFLRSYDVFSLRVALRDLDIQPETSDALKLSPEMNKELATYMTDFTRPLIMQIYGGDDMDIETFDDVISLFRDPDVKKALEKLKIMAEKLGIKVEELPKFIEDYGDIFLSLAYYRRCLDAIEPVISDFLFALPDLRNNYSLKTDVSLQNTLNMLERRFTELMVQLTGRFESFDRGTENMWDNITAEKFQKFKRVLSSYHQELGGTLCALSVKMDAWNKLFPERTLGGPQRRSEFIMTEMRLGVDKIPDMSVDAPMAKVLEG